MKKQGFLIFILPLLLIYGCNSIIANNSPKKQIEDEIRVVYENDALQDISPVSFSPNGKRILLQVLTKDGSNYPAIINLDGSNFRILSKGISKQSVINVIGYSSDGSKILYQSGERIYTIGINGTGAELLLEKCLVGINKAVAFSPDNQLLLYNTTCGPGTGHINIVNTDGSNSRQLTDFPSVAIGFSTDGSKILFLGTIEGDTDIWIMDKDGQNKKNLTKDSNSQNVIERDEIPVTFTANGQRILYRADGIRLMNKDGSNKTIVTKNYTDVPTVISPNGELIAFYEAATVGICSFCTVDKIGLISSDGANRTIFNEKQYNYTRIVDFSPNGQYILFSGRSKNINGFSTKILIAKITY